MSVIVLDNILFFECIKCGIGLEVHIKDLNCKIFRCGAYKKNLQPIHHHASKYDCDKLVRDNLIIGCGCAFEIIQIQDLYTAVECSYYR